MPLTRERPVRVLLVEDSPGDVSLTKEALRGARVSNELVVVGDGEAAIAYLTQGLEDGASAMADLVLLDLNLPRMDGHGVLRRIKSDPQLKHIPVVVLTTSADEGDILASYELHANAYVTKPVGFDDFLVALRQLEGFWLQVVRLPTDAAQRA